MTLLKSFAVDSSELSGVLAALDLVELANDAHANDRSYLLKVHRLPAHLALLHGLPDIDVKTLVSPHLVVVLDLEQLENWRAQELVEVARFALLSEEVFNDAILRVDLQRILLTRHSCVRRSLVIVVCGLTPLRTF